MDPAFAAETETLVQILDQLDYFQVLKLPQTAAPAQIREAFHRESRLYHPDRFNALPDEALKNNVHRIYRRVTEAYVTLRDDVKRPKYLADISGPERERKLRFTEAGELEVREQQKKAQAEQLGATVKGRQLYQQALRDFEAGRFDAALRNLKMATTFEPSTQIFKDKLGEVEKKMKEKAS